MLYCIRARITLSLYFTTVQRASLMPSAAHPITTKTFNTTSPSIDRLLRWPDVHLIVGICRSHAHQLAIEGKFPAPVKLVEGGRASAWIESEVHDWVQSRIASRPAAATAAQEG